MVPRVTKVTFLVLLVSTLLVTQTVDLARSEVGDLIVVLDPGHGGRDPGAIGITGLQEKEVTRNIARLVSFESYDYPAIKVILTRYGDKYIHPYDRTQFANSRGADLFISIHADSFGDPSIHGATTFVAEQAGFQSKRLARVIQKFVAARSGGTNRGIRSKSLFIRESEVPAILVEVGFLSNPSEARRLGKLSYQRKIAVGLLEGVQSYLRNYM